MRIGIDAHILGKQKGGVETCIEFLIRALAGVDRRNQYYIYVSSGQPFRPGELPSNFSLSPLPIESPWIERSVLIPYLYWRDALDVIHLQRATPFFGCQNTVLHVHDAIYHTHPHLIPSWKRAILNPIFRYSGWRAKSVITTSGTSREEIVRHYDIDSGKIHVVPDGVSSASFFPVQDRRAIDDASGRFGLRRPYAIYLGAMERNKNVHVLLNAFAKFRSAFPLFQLALVGKYRSETRGGYLEELRTVIGDLGLENAALFTGYVSEEDRRLLLNGAEMLVFPSECEGFGLPPLEAMACGVPCIATDLPVIREVYGDSLLTCHLNDPEDLARVMRALASDPHLSSTLRERGFAKVPQFSWETHARKVLEVYREFDSA